MFIFEGVLFQLWLDKRLKATKLEIKGNVSGRGDGGQGCKGVGFLEAGAIITLDWPVLLPHNWFAAAYRSGEERFTKMMLGPKGKPGVAFFRTRSPIKCRIIVLFDKI